MSVKTSNLRGTSLWVGQRAIPMTGADFAHPKLLCLTLTNRVTQDDACQERIRDWITDTLSLNLNLS